MSEECRGCKKGITETNSREVGHWRFCLECFERLTTSPKDPAPAVAANRSLQNASGPAPVTPVAVPDTSPRAPPTRSAVQSASQPAPVAPGPVPSASQPAPTRSAANSIQPAAPALPLAPTATQIADAARASTSRSCITCEKLLVATDFVDFGGMSVCDSCYRELILVPFERAERELEEELEPAAPAEAAEPVPVVPVGVAGKKTCTTCGRRLIEPGGYSLIEGAPYCPSCASKARAAPSPAPTPNASAEVCEACDRAFTGAAPQNVDGFLLCRPCFTTDAQSALDIARARHRARLNELRKNLGLANDR